jgi:glycosyltransferase involved in cell wall biosynthesis
VFHHGSQTFKASGIDHAGLMLRNRGIFLDRVAALAASPAAAARRGGGAVGEPRISVIVRTQDRPQELREALRSLANQIFADFEVALVNDGGPDLGELLSEFPSLRICYVRHQQALGRAAALNAGVRAAQCDWLCYLDDDDIVYPNHLDAFAAAIDANPEAGVLYADTVKAMVLRKDGQLHTLVRRPDPPFEFSRPSLLVRNNLPIQAYVHHRRCLEEVGAVKAALDLLEDWDLLIRLSQRYDFVHIPRMTSE